MSPFSTASRRDLLRAGLLGSTGLSLAQLLSLRKARCAAPRPQADACIFLFLWGAPASSRPTTPNPMLPTASAASSAFSAALPGILFSEHIPQLARRNHRFSIVRT